jgi:hypothetical protein
VQAPDGTIWKVATPAKKDTGLMIGGDAGPFTDPDGFTWAAAAR